MGREKVLLIMSFPGIVIPLTYAIYFHQSFLNNSIDENLLYNSFINSLLITTAIIITLTFFLYFFSILLGGPLLYLFFSFMGHLLNLFNSSIIMIIIQKIFNIHLVHKKKIFLYYIIAFLISIYGLIRAELIYFDKNEIKVEHWKNEKEGLKVKIAHLSDLHLCPIYGRKLVEKIII